MNEPNPYVEVARSFSLKKNLGNYESADFFCSAKRECMPDEIGEMSEKLINFCRTQVERDVAQFMLDRAKEERKELEGSKPTTPVNYASGGQLKQSFWDTPRGEEMRERLNERAEDYGLDNGPRGSKFEG